MTSLPPTMTQAGQGTPGSLSVDEMGAVSPPRGSLPVPDRAGRPSDRIFSREWRAYGDAAPMPAHKSGPRPVGTTPRAHREKHVPVEVHYARKGHYLSSLRCLCGSRLLGIGNCPSRSHEALADAWLAHRRKVGARMG